MDTGKWLSLGATKMDLSPLGASPPFRWIPSNGSSLASPLGEPDGHPPMGLPFGGLPFPLGVPFLPDKRPFYSGKGPTGEREKLSGKFPLGGACLGRGGEGKRDVRKGMDKRAIIWYGLPIILVLITLHKWVRVWNIWGNVYE